MKKVLRSASLVVAASLLIPQAATANDELLVMQENPAWYTMPTLDYANTRYSKLTHIDKDNVGDLQVADRKSVV